ncbi:4-(cytidine 5'-diphospho)-2-C-methyl-D-erythritol kinase [Aliikangiella marina]|uniref:4-diphosphocytidyl-2-C-methyl-D-erythritol kinase n=2 Tax=Aliikangiella marina TaxID=1712262 RepID=A0A545TH56_9GAMM|nr:4-(cytidine 5'-diphospho)-2-C-methyl-D-erythritol kinase [Aliikangiella marina]
MLKHSKILWPSPCKLNLFLHFIGQRDDGYHRLQSLFQLIDFGDDILIETNDSQEIEFHCDVAELSNTDNLIVKAAEALKAYVAQATNQATPNKAPMGASIRLTKRLPFGGGVGGGSSNCATTLVALNHQWQLGLSLDQLAQIGLKLGADVPIFVRGQTAFVEGIGEIITPTEMPEIWYLVVQPECHVSTAKIFSNPLLTRNSKAITIRDLNALGLPFKGRNTMQDIVCRDYPAVAEVLKWLVQFSSNARMTGSGSCLFIPFDNEQEVRKIATRCSWPHFVAKGVNQSPLHRKLEGFIKPD